MDDRRLKEYALKIYNNVSGYSLQKAFTLFPKYYPKIAFYYSELITKKQEELTTRTIQLVGIRLAINTKLSLQNIAIKQNYLRSTLITKIKTDLSKGTPDLADYVKEVMIQHEYLQESYKAFDVVEELANKYMFKDLAQEILYERNKISISYQRDSLEIRRALENYVKEYNIIDNRPVSYKESHTW